MDHHQKRHPLGCLFWWWFTELKALRWEKSSAQPTERAKLVVCKTFAASGRWRRSCRNAVAEGLSGHLLATKKLCSYKVSAPLRLQVKLKRQRAHKLKAVADTARMTRRRGRFYARIYFEQLKSGTARWSMTVNLMSKVSSPAGGAIETEWFRWHIFIIRFLYD